MRTEQRTDSIVFLPEACYAVGSPQAAVGGGDCVHPLRRVAFSLLLMQQKELLAGRKEPGVIQTMPGAGGRIGR